MFGKKLFIRFTVRVFREPMFVSFCACPSSPFGFQGGMWDVFILIPDHCLSIYFVCTCCGIKHLCRKRKLNNVYFPGRDSKSECVSTHNLTDVQANQEMMQLLSNLSDVKGKYSIQLPMGMYIYTYGGCIYM